MALLLTTVFNPGDIDAGKTYSHLKIQDFDLHTSSKVINFFAEYGNESEGVWQRGAASPALDFQVTGPDYDAMIVAQSTADDGGSGHEIYSGAKRLLYQWLIDNGHAVGAVE